MIRVMEQAALKQIDYVNIYFIKMTPHAVVQCFSTWYDLHTVNKSFEITFPQM